MAIPESAGAFRRVATGLCFVVAPLPFVFAFAVHPGLLHPHFLSPAELILRARGAPLLQLGHGLVTLDTALLLVIALHFIGVLDRAGSPRTGLIGGVAAGLGALALVADKAALCLSMSAFERLSDAEFAGMQPGLLALFEKQGWLVLLWGIVLLPAGFAIQAVGLLRSGVLPRWQGLLFLAAAVLIATPDGAEVVNLSASILLALAFFPYGIRLMRPPVAQRLVAGIQL
ncbi:MAG: hypothetical protein AB7S39_20575 [Gemmatimonadales bacterium]